MMVLVMTISFTVALLLASCISTVVMFKLVNSKKFIEWYKNWFVAYIEKFEHLDE